MQHWETLEHEFIPDITHVIGRGRSRQAINLCPVGFDIETTNDSDTQTAYMYIWQCAVNGIAYYGRTWDEFFCFMALLRDKLHGEIIVLIHNMAFEMTFLLPRLHRADMIERVFAKQKREPLEVVLKNGIIFRDTMAITNMSLAALAKNYCRTQKLVGDLDYSIPRNSATPLTDTELAYCENDVLVLSEFAEYLHAEYTLKGAKIPYTSTGIVRRMVKQHLPGYKFKDTCKWVSTLYPRTAAQYNYTMTYLYRGAFCHAQTAICGQVIKNVHSHDLKSAYPAEMAHRLYPVTPFEAIPAGTALDCIKRGRAVIMLCEFTDITATGAHVLESRHKIITAEGAEYENGRLYHADTMQVLITDVDYKIYCMMYHWKQLKIIGAKAATKGFLPDYLLKPLFKVYTDKERIGKQAKADENNLELYQMYMSSKMKLNSFYGMCVARLNLTEIVYNGEWVEQPSTTYDEAKSNSVLSPYWGIYITAYTRLTICTAITALGNCAFYSDTDSIKHNADFGYFDSFNERMENINRAMCDKYQLDFDVFKNLGKFDYEGTYDRFKTLGAKRYITEAHGEVKCTVAGLPKRTFSEFAKRVGNDRAFELFSPDLSFTVSGKNAHKYNEETTANICGENMHEYGSCYIYSVPFVMRVDTAFLLAISARERIIEQ